MVANVTTGDGATDVAITRARIVGRRRAVGVGQRQAEIGGVGTLRKARLGREREALQRRLDRRRARRHGVGQAVRRQAADAEVRQRAVAIAQHRRGGAVGHRIRVGDHDRAERCDRRPAGLLAGLRPRDRVLVAHRRAPVPRPPREKIDIGPPQIAAVRESHPIARACLGARLHHLDVRNQRRDLILWSYMRDRRRRLRSRPTTARRREAGCDGKTTTNRHRSTTPAGPFHAAGPIVEIVRARLAARAERLGWREPEHPELQAA